MRAASARLLGAAGAQVVCADLDELAGGAESGALPRRLKELLGGVVLEGSAAA